jgi:hypothetical protein
MLQNLLHFVTQTEFENLKKRKSYKQKQLILN